MKYFVTIIKKIKKNSADIDKVYYIPLTIHLIVFKTNRQDYNTSAVLFQCAKIKYELIIKNKMDSEVFNINKYISFFRINRILLHILALK